METERWNLGQADLGELQSGLPEGVINKLYVQMSNEPLDQSTAFGFRKSEKQQQDKSEAHLGMQADVSNARKQYAISGGGAAKRCHTSFRSTFCFELGKVDKLERPKYEG